MRVHRQRRCKALRARSWLGPVLLLTATLAGAAEPVSHATESIDAAARPRALAAKPRIGRLFFSPAERRTRHNGGLAATPATPIGNRIEPRERLVVNGALRVSGQGRTVWVNGAAVENSARDKTAWTDRNGNVWLINGTEGTHLLRPGQSIDRNGVIDDLLPPGAVTRR
jgi:hypothetical protein